MTALGEDAPRDDKHLVARDAKHVPLLSAYGWNGEAVERILRVPSGFMRNRTQERIEALAAERGAAEIDLALVEEGIAIGRKLMEEMIQSQAAAKAAGAASDPHAAVAAPQHDVSAVHADSSPAHPDAAATTAHGAAVPPSVGSLSAGLAVASRPALNEVGSAAVLHARRAGPRAEPGS